MPLPTEIWRAGLGIATALGGVTVPEAAPSPILDNQPPYQPNHQIVMPGSFEANREAAGLPDFELKPFSQPEVQPAGETLATENVTLLRLAPEADFQAITYEVRKLGGTVTLELPGFALIGNMPPTLQLTDPGILEFRRTPFSVEELADQFTDPTQLRWAQAWNSFITQPPMSAEALEETAQALVNDAFEVPPEERPPQVAAQEMPTTPNFYETSEFALGRFAVRIVTPESQGPASTENWTEDELRRILGEHFNAFHWLATRYPANLTFVFDSQSAVPIPVSSEPIQLRQVDQGFWITETMNFFGFTEGSYFNRVRLQNNWLREHHNTLWAITAFVVDSSNDSDHKFADGHFAYAYLGGPFLVMTYGNNGYGPGNMDAVGAHEWDHTVRGLDQYYSAYQPCTRRSGYLDVENQNSQYNPYGGECATNEVDIMRGLTYPFTYGYLNPAPAGISPSGAGQVGWRDGWRLDCAANQWIPGQDGVLDPAGGLCWQTEVSPDVISATLQLKPLANAVLNGNSVLHVNTLLGAWARSGGRIFNPQEATLSTDGQALTVLIPVPPETAPLDLCIGTQLQNACQNLVPRPKRLLYLPIIQREEDR